MLKGYASDNDDDESVVEEPIVRKPKKPAAKKAGSVTAKKIVPFERGEIVEVVVPRGRQQRTSMKGVALDKRAISVKDQPPTNKFADPLQTLLVWVPGLGPQICSFAMLDGRVVAVPLMPSVAVTKGSLAVPEEDDKPVLTASACTTFTSTVKEIAKITGIDAKNILEFGMNALQEIFRAENQEWIAFLSPKTEDEAKALIVEMQAFNLLEKTISDDDTKLIVEALVVVADSAAAGPARAAPRRAADSQKKTYVLSADMPMVTVKIMPPSLARMLDKSSSGGVICVPMTHGGAPYFDAELLASFKAEAAKHEDEFSVRITELPPYQQYHAFFFVPKKDGDNFIHNGLRIDSAEVSLVRYFDLPVDLRDLVDTQRAEKHKRKATSSSSSEPAAKKVRVEETPEAEETASTEFVL